MNNSLTLYQEHKFPHWDALLKICIYSLKTESCHNANVVLSVRSRDSRYDNRLCRQCLEHASDILPIRLDGKLHDGDDL